MNLVEYIDNMVYPLIDQADEGGKPLEEPGGQLHYQDLLIKMEMDIREGIAQEIEQLVAGGEASRWHGIPSMADAYRNPFELQQDVMRGAANVVRGKDPATEEDWLRQQERLRAMAALRDLQRGKSSMLTVPGDLAENADVPPMPTDAELQRKFDESEERKREWND